MRKRLFDSNSLRTISEAAQKGLELSKAVCVGLIDPRPRQVKNTKTKGIQKRSPVSVSGRCC